MATWLALVGGVLLLWHGALALHFVSPAALAYPAEVLVATPRLLASGAYLPDVWSTLSYSMVAFLLSIPLGLLAGVAVFFSGSAREPSQFFLDFLRSIPATALAPVFLIVFGIGDSTKLAVGSFSSALVICLATVTGLRNRNTTRLAVSKIAGVKPSRRVLFSDLPEIAPQVFLGLRAGISLALVLVVVCEMLVGSNRGLGRVISDMRFTDDKPLLYAALITSGLIGYSFNAILALLERRLVHWTIR
jgi:NitT/TauT family transport system permease protein